MNPPVKYPYVSYNHIELSNDSLILTDEVPADFGNVSRKIDFLLIAVFFSRPL